MGKGMEIICSSNGVVRFDLVQSNPAQIVINLAKQGYCNHFVCLSVCLSVCFLCVRSVDIYTHAWKNTWNTTRNIMLLYHSALLAT